MRLRKYASGMVVFLTCRAAYACTVCDSATAHQVRAGIFDGGFASHLLAVVLPFAVLAAVVTALALVTPEWVGKAEE